MQVALLIEAPAPFADEAPAREKLTADYAAAYKQAQSDISTTFNAMGAKSVKKALASLALLEKPNAELTKILETTPLTDSLAQDFAAKTKAIFDQAKSDSVKMILDELRPSGGGQPTATVPAPPSPAAELTADPQKVLADKGVYDIFDPKHVVLLFKTEKSLAGYYFPDSRPTTAEGFDKLTDAQRIDKLQSIILDDFIVGIENDPAYKKLTADEKKSVMAAAESGYYKNKAKTEAEKIVKSGKADEVPIPNVVSLPERYWKELHTKLGEERRRSTSSTSDTLRKESESDRIERFTKIAVELAMSMSPARFPSESSIPEAAMALMKDVATEYARLTGPTPPEAKKPGSKELDSELESKIKRGIRILYKTFSGFTQVMGPLGLKEYLIQLVVKAVIDHIGRDLNSDELVKAQGWAHDLATEFQGSTQPTQPVVPITRPSPLVSPYPSWPMPMMPAMPYGWGGHHGNKSWHHKPAVYVVPGMGGYLVVPR
ncbi:hypothetical protein GC170_09595 [bacterium]|nr:hypothetical protein [bacterium]